MPENTVWKDGRPVVPVESLGLCSPLTEWLVTGPFVVSVPGQLHREMAIGRADSIDVDPIGCETTVRPCEGDQLPNALLPEGVASWRRVSGSAEYDLKAMWPGVDSAVAYAATYLSASEPTTIALRAESWAHWQNSTVQMILDGVEVGHNSAPTVVTLTPGEHCLVLKIGGGGTRSYAWTLKAIAGCVAPVCGSVGVALPRFSGFWQGEEGFTRGGRLTSR